ncbi:hypothetical protein BaRGS_00018880 [Batillaria attramentaria]|uniref:G-protein coupled receptors family 1 profile domain-containing protein n=1 Tax=Batillaria attramentaria TaxID=370345 RepID=A0ABD0KSL0_9CAEN
MQFAGRLTVLPMYLAAMFSRAGGGVLNLTTEWNSRDITTQSVLSIGTQESLDAANGTEDSWDFANGTQHLLPSVNGTRTFDFSGNTTEDVLAVLNGTQGALDFVNGTDNVDLANGTQKKRNETHGPLTLVNGTLGSVNGTDSVDLASGTRDVNGTRGLLALVNGTNDAHANETQDVLDVFGGATDEEDSDGSTRPTDDSGCLVLSSIPQYRQSANSVLDPDIVYRIMRPQLILAFIVVVLGMVGNVINMVVFSKLGLRERINLCLFWLACADFFSLVHHIFVYGENTYQLTNGALRMVVFNYHLIYVSAFRSISYYMSAVISVERCICITKPLQAKLLLNNKPTVAAIVLGSLFLLGSETFQAFQFHMRVLYIVLPGYNVNFSFCFKNFSVGNLAVFVTGDLRSVQNLVFMLSNFLVLVNSSVNIIVYYRYGSRYREQFQSTFLCRGRNQSAAAGARPLTATAPNPQRKRIAAQKVGGLAQLSSISSQETSLSSENVSNSTETAQASPEEVKMST